MKSIMMIFIENMCLGLSNSKSIQIFSEIYLEPIDKEYFKRIKKEVLIKNSKVLCLICIAIEKAFNKKYSSKLWFLLNFYILYNVIIQSYNLKLCFWWNFNQTLLLNIEIKRFN